MFQRQTQRQMLFFFFLILFIYFWLCWVFVSVQGLPLVAESGSHSSSRCADLSLFIADLSLFIAVRRPLTIAASLVVDHRLQTRRLSSYGSLSSCGSQAQLLRGMWDLPRPGLEPVSPALAGRFSTTAPPGKPQIDALDCLHDLYFILPLPHLNSFFCLSSISTPCD